MKFSELMAETAGMPLFETGLLLVGDRDPNDVRRQLSRWTASGKLLQLKRGLYALAPPYQKQPPHPFLAANRLVLGSYVSLETALAHYGLIPEFVPAVLSMTTRSPAEWENPLGSFRFHHITRDLFTGYRHIEVNPGQQAYLALPEKALLDLVHLTPGGEDPDYLAGLRLQNLDRLDLDRLHVLSSGRPKLARVAGEITLLARAEAEAYEIL